MKECGWQDRLIHFLSISTSKSDLMWCIWPLEYPQLDILRLLEMVIWTNNLQYTNPQPYVHWHTKLISTCTYRLSCMATPRRVGAWNMLTWQKLYWPWSKPSLLTHTTPPYLRSLTSAKCPQVEGLNDNFGTSIFCNDHTQHAFVYRMRMCTSTGFLREYTLVILNWSALKTSGATVVQYDYLDLYPATASI